MASNNNTRQIAVVIGASRGIGRQIAVDLAKEGYAGKYLSYKFPSDDSTEHILISLVSGRRRQNHHLPSRPRETYPLSP